MLLFVDGGPRNFQFVQRLVLHCWKENIDYDETNFMNTIDQSNIIKVPLFYTQCRVRKDFEGLAHFVLYKKELADASIVWVCKPVYLPVFEPGVHEKDDHCNTNIVHIVPALHKYRPRLFPSVKHICSALSSTSLPSLKKRFSKGKGLELRLFTEVLFYQLWKTCPSVLEPDEASYTVAMLHDLFGQIDYNGKPYVYIPLVTFAFDLAFLTQYIICVIFFAVVKGMVMWIGMNSLLFAYILVLWAEPVMDTEVPL